MLIHVDRIPWEGLDLAGEEPASVLDLANESDVLRPEGPMGYDLQARIVSREVLVRGRLSVSMGFSCRRCLEFFPLRVAVPDFQEVYPFEDPYAILDLTCDLRESIILAFPTFPVCAESCRGLCPQCGANRNRTVCTCRQPAIGDCWSVLDGLGLRGSTGGTE